MIWIGEVWHGVVSSPLWPLLYHINQSGVNQGTGSLVGISQHFFGASESSFLSQVSDKETISASDKEIKSRIVSVLDESPREQTLRLVH